MPLEKDAAKNTGQLALCFPVREDAVGAVLKQLIGKPLNVVITDNSSSMLSYRKNADRVTLRMHRMFLSADMPLLAEIAAFVKNRRAGTPLMRAFIRAGDHLIKPKNWRCITVNTKGRFHDLSELFKAINERYFAGRIAAAITWSSREPRTGVRKRNLGSYDHRRDLIRISRYLDRRAVPRYFIAYVVYHEMLHADLGVRRNNGRTIVHCREFRTREQLYHDFARAMAWEKSGL